MSKGAPKGNKNAALKDGAQPRHGMAWMMSVPHEEWGAFKAAADLFEGRPIDDEEAYKELLRGLCRGAIRRFIDRHQGLEDPSVATIV